MERKQIYLLVGIILLVALLYILPKSPLFSVEDNQVVFRQCVVGSELGGYGCSGQASSCTPKPVISLDVNHDGTLEQYAYDGPYGSATFSRALSFKTPEGYTIWASSDMANSQMYNIVIDLGGSYVGLRRGGNCSTSILPIPQYSAHEVLTNPQICISNCSGKTCGGDGCGGTCGSGCAAGVVCSSDGQCDVSCLNPATCLSLGYNCGSWSNGCGSTLSCGTCPSNQNCILGVCTAPSTCIPDNSCASITCTGQTCINNCGTFLSGTKTCGTPNPTPTCSDGIKNGAETGIDCGGSCTACSAEDIKSFFDKYKMPILIIGGLVIVLLLFRKK